MAAHACHEFDVSQVTDIYLDLLQGGVYLSVQEARSELIKAFVDHPWLNMLHLHVGSQGLQLDAVVAGITAVWQLLLDIEGQCGRGRIQVLDIGGGLSVDFTTDQPPEVRNPAVAAT